jgi:predicted TIM-barrel fold metal-dependent hydrolase
MRGVAVVYPDTPTSDIERWHALGTRATRCNVLFDGGVSADLLPRIIERVRDFGWHLQVLMDVSREPQQVLALADLGVPLVVDHCGHVQATDALGSRGFQNLLALLREGRAWVKLCRHLVAGRSIAARKPGAISMGQRLAAPCHCAADG